MLTELWAALERRKVIEMRNKILSTLFLLFLVVGLVRCGASAPAAMEAPAELMQREAGESAPAMDEEMMSEAPMPTAMPEEFEGSADSTTIKQMVIRTANLSLVVEDTDQAMTAIQSLAEELGGYVAQSNTYQVREGLMDGSITVRVPAGSFSQALQSMKDLAETVTNESVSGEDVTQEYTDLKSRLRNLEATETELLELLKTVRERTGKAEDILAVHREVTNIRGQIEQSKGRMQYLEQMSAMSTITVGLTMERPVVEEGWAPQGTVRDALRALVDALQGLANLIIWFILFLLPLIILLLIPVAIIFLIVRWILRRRKKRQQS
jgi:hypothetical protein